MSGRQVGDPDRGVGDVDVLAAGAARSVGVDAQILVLDLDVDVVRQLRPDEDGRERGVPARRLIERRDAHEPVDAGLGQHQAVRVVADDRHRRALDAGFVAGLQVDDVALEAAALRPAQVHAQQHLGPVLRLGAAGAGMDRHDRVLAIVLAAEHLLGLAGVDVAATARRGRAAEVVERPARLPRAHSTSTARSSTRRRSDSREIAVLLEPAPALQQLLRGRLILPEVRIGDALLYGCEFLCGAGGVKDSSADRRRGAPDPDTCEAVRPVVGPYSRILSCQTCQ